VRRIALDALDARDAVGEAVIEKDSAPAGEHRRAPR
jgi:hypothetical protein